MGWTTFDSAGAQLERSFSDTPVGTITGYGGAAAPSGWLLCDGSAVSRTAYAELFSVIGTTYGTGNGSTTFNVPNGDGDIIYAQSISSRVATASPPQYVTSLPSNPVDGQTVVYAADATNGVMWTLRYRAAATGSYKWDVLGGPPLTAFVATQQSRATNSYGDLTTSGPSVTVPLAGDYDVQVGAGVQTPANTGVFATSRVSYQVGSTSASNDDSAYQVNFNSGAGETHEASVVSPLARKTGVAVSSAITAKYLAYGGTHYFANRWITVTPVRVG
jgi:microcystin-dependent protein